MTLFRLFLVAFLAILVGYTLVVMTNHGANLFAQFFGDIAAVAWPGQFNLDFMGFLALSAIWVAWRNDFSGSGYALSVLAFLGGMLFLTIYLLFLSRQTKGDIAAMLLGASRAGS